MAINPQDYARLGDTAPTPRMGSEMLSNLSLYDTPARQLVLTDVQLDLGVVTQNPRYVRRAAQQLGGIASTAKVDYAGRGSTGRQGEFMARAYLRLAEIPAWQAAAQGQQPQNDYQHMVDYGVLAPLHTDEHAGYRLQIFCIGLLGARALQFGLPGWQARQALYRERERPKSSGVNWNTGIYHDLASFKDPLKLRMVGGYNRNMGAGGTTGVTPIYRDQLEPDFEPASVVWSCALETGEDMPGVPTGITRYTTEELHRITAAIGTAIGSMP